MDAEGVTDHSSKVAVAPLDDPTVEGGIFALERTPGAGPHNRDDMMRALVDQGLSPEQAEAAWELFAEHGHKPYDPSKGEFDDFGDFLGESFDMGDVSPNLPYDRGRANKGVMSSIHEHLKTGAIGDAGGGWPLMDWVNTTRKAISHGRLTDGDNSLPVSEQQVVSYLKRQGLDDQDIPDVMAELTPFIQRWNAAKEERNLGPWTGYDR
jgi:hypothetical protein